jgi:hypothetical protein
MTQGIQVGVCLCFLVQKVMTCIRGVLACTLLSCLGTKAAIPQRKLLTSMMFLLFLLTPLEFQVAPESAKHFVSQQLLQTPLAPREGLRNLDWYLRSLHFHVPQKSQAIKLFG